MEQWSDFSLSISVDDILRGQGADPEVIRRRRPSLVEMASSAFERGFEKIKPSVAINESRVSEHRHNQIIMEGGQKLTGSLVSEHLAGAESIYAAACTIGEELERFAASQEDLLLSLALDGLGNAAAEQLAQQVCEKFGEHAAIKGLQAGTPLSPGEAGWPVEVGQPEVFSLIDPTKAGIRLTEGGMMVPRKSVSFVVGTGKNMSQIKPCDTCSLKEVCRYRRH